MLLLQVPLLTRVCCGTPDTHVRLQATDGGAVRATSVRKGVTITRSRFSGNAAQAHGGAIMVDSGDLTVLDSTFSGNSATQVGRRCY